MIKKKHIRIICFPAAVLFFLAAGQKAANSDSFLNPARNSYSLDKTIDRPFLQSVPIPRVWQTDSSSDIFRKAWLNLNPSGKSEDRMFGILSLQSDIADFQNDFQSLIIEDQRSEKNNIADMLDEIVPVLDAVDGSVALDIEEADRVYDSYQKNLLRAEQKGFSEQLSGMQTFFVALKEIIRIDFELEKLDRILKTKEFQEKKIVEETPETFLSDTIIDRAEDFYFHETEHMGGLKECDDAVWSLLINDMLDLSTGINMMANDSFLIEKTDESKRGSASLLDSAKKTDQIQGNDLLKEKRILMQRLQKMLKSDKIKDVK
ncbi:MAG: hypothetical protein IJ846_06445 [Alphaproteobacteria bacterium]|nr:hypothetical protein [Alphaproteobacteria bacterium]